MNARINLKVAKLVKKVAKFSTKVAKKSLKLAKFRSKVAKYLVSGTAFSSKQGRIFSRKQRIKEENLDWSDDMIIKKRAIPLSVQKMQALLRRIPPNHPKHLIIKENLSKRLSGYKGETYLDYPLSFLSEKDTYILHDLRLKDSANYFQLDSLIITPNYMLILEVKHIVGTIYFDQVFHQLIRTLDGNETVLENPMIQISRQEMQLEKWLQNNRFPKVPILSLVVFSHPKALLRTSPKDQELGHKIIHRHLLPTKFLQFEKEYPEECLTKKEIKKMIKCIRDQDTPFDQPILEQYEIHYDELQKGILCPSCGHCPMVRDYGKWCCKKCNNQGKDLHIEALRDYYFLFGPEITNKKARDFLQISSPYLASRLLHSMNMKNIGVTKDKIYYLSFEEKLWK
ncbi:nuclease-related domain-containing protein [Metabacillus sp. Hm71]|uniref:nuclease-related domain-containing protein n=1 Tax=Metabacillus sp. Hm71 TaxID=3450743 RepID=UPI003F437D6E